MHCSAFVWWREYGGSTRPAAWLRNPSSSEMQGDKPRVLGICKLVSISQNKSMRRCGEDKFPLCVALQLPQLTLHSGAPVTNMYNKTWNYICPSGPVLAKEVPDQATCFNRQGTSRDALRPVKVLVPSASILVLSASQKGQRCDMKLFGLI